jgi:uncharacterized membrane protein YdbT with pleckstrin-like domain
MKMENKPLEEPVKSDDINSRRINRGFKIIIVINAVLGFFFGNNYLPGSVHNPESSFWTRIVSAIILLCFVAHKIIDWRKDVAEIKRLRKELGK